MTTSSSYIETMVREAATALLAGNLVAFPTETVYGLGADACNEKAVARIYEVKDRPTDHPLIVHISSINNLEKWAKDIPEYALKLAKSFWPGPMSLILPKTILAKNFVTGNQESVGIRVPDHPVAMALLSEFEEIGGLGIAAPSANVFGAVSPTTFEAVKMEIGYKLNREDLILDGGSSKVGIESTIIDCQSNDPTILRPGAITKEMIVNVLDKEVKLKIQNPFNSPVKTPGMHQSHYAPKSKVIIDGTPNLGDGFIALDSIKTPKGAIRLASPKNNEQFARELYAAFRLGDSFSLSKIIVISPVGSGIAIAINDRLKRSAFNEQL